MSAFGKFIAAVVVVASLIGFASRSDASVILSLDQPDALLSQGGSVDFFGEITNDGADEVFLNGDFSVLPYVALALDDSAFFDNAPLFLAPGASYAGPLFRVLASSAAPAGLYLGTFGITGGPSDDSFATLAVAGFTVSVQESSPVPEPQSLMLVVTGASALWIRSRAVRRRRPSAKSAAASVRTEAGSGTAWEDTGESAMSSR